MTLKVNGRTHNVDVDPAKPQPNFGPFSAKSSLSTYSSGVAGSTSNV